MNLVRTRIKDIALPSFREFNEYSCRENNLSKEEHECLKKLTLIKNYSSKKRQR